MLWVALFTRAWIEIWIACIAVYYMYVALFTRAWIEILTENQTLTDPEVALFTRAWIEIGMHRLTASYLQCRPLHEGVD